MEPPSGGPEGGDPWAGRALRVERMTGLEPATLTLAR
jgi:hypothetical protein